MLYYRSHLGEFPDRPPGGMAEWLKAVVLKTIEALRVSGGSNPSPSASTGTDYGEVPEWTIGAAC